MVSSDLKTKLAVYCIYAGIALMFVYSNIYDDISKDLKYAKKTLCTWDPDAFTRDFDIEAGFLSHTPIYGRTAVVHPAQDSPYPKNATWRAITVGRGHWFRRSAMIEANRFFRKIRSENYVYRCWYDEPGDPIVLVHKTKEGEMNKSIAVIVSSVLMIVIGFGVLMDQYIRADDELQERLP